MEDLTREVKVFFERLTGLLPLAPMNSYWGDLRSPSDPEMRRSGAVGHQTAAMQ